MAAADVGPAPARAGLGGHRRRGRADQPDERRGHRLRPGIGDARRRPVPRRSGIGPGAVRPAGRRALRRLPPHGPPVLRSSSATRGSCAPACACRSSTDAIAHITLAVMGNLVDNTTPGAAGKVLWLADKTLGLADPVLRKTRAHRLTAVHRLPPEKCPDSRAERAIPCTFRRARLGHGRIDDHGDRAAPGHQRRREEQAADGRSARRGRIRRLRRPDDLPAEREPDRA